MAVSTRADIISSRGSEAKFRAFSEFDSEKMRHYLNGTQTVLHCHHYVSLFTQLAGDAEDLEGPKLLADAATETFYPILRDYYENNKISALMDRLAVAEQYFSYIGMGEIRFEFYDCHGSAILKHSHVDEGWLKKWGQNKGRVNFIGEGFIRAVCAAVFDINPESELSIVETQSIVKGASRSMFEIKW